MFEKYLKGAAQWREVLLYSLSPDRATDASSQFLGPVYAVLI